MKEPPKAPPLGVPVRVKGKAYQGIPERCRVTGKVADSDGLGLLQIEFQRDDGTAARAWFRPDELEVHYG